MTDNTEPTVQEKTAWAKVPQAFNDWWNGDYSDESNPFRINSAAYWAWAGWSEAVRLNAQAVPDWVPVTQQLLNSQEPWLYKTCWLAFPSGAVLTGVYEWRQGRKPDRFISAEVGDVWAFDVSHVMPVTPPPNPSTLSAAPAAPQPAQPLTEKDALLRQALEALEGFANITNDSQGVKGYHLNGDIAEWDEFDEVDAASNTIEAIRAHLGVKND